MGTDKLNVGRGVTPRWVSTPSMQGGVEILLIAACHRNRDMLQSRLNLAFHYPSPKNLTIIQSFFPFISGYSPGWFIEQIIIKNEVTSHIYRWARLFMNPGISNTHPTFASWKRSLLRVSIVTRFWLTLAGFLVGVGSRRTWTTEVQRGFLWLS